MPTMAEDVQQKKKRGLRFFLIFAALGWGLYVYFLTLQFLQTR